MSIWRQLHYGVRNLVRRTKHDQDIADEMQQYLDEATASLKDQGLSTEEAGRRARLQIGNLASEREQANSYGWEHVLRVLARDLRFAWRQLLKHPIFSATATITLALGIGANTAIFTVVHTVLLSPLPYSEPNSIAAVQTHWISKGRTSTRVTGPDGVDLRDKTKAFESFALYTYGTVGVQMRDHSAYSAVGFIDSGFEKVFRLQPVAGHLSNGTQQGVGYVSEQFARDNFGSVDAALGQALKIENEPVIIVAVLPTSFTFPGKSQVWQLTERNPANTSRTAFNYRAVARLRGGVGFSSAQAELDALSQQLRAAYPEEDRDKQFTLLPLQKALTGAVRPTLVLLCATVGLILLISCVNVTHLQLVRSMEQQRELAIRKALGSSRWQVMLPVILESLMLAVAGAIAGIAIAIPAVHLLVAIAPTQLPRAEAIHLNAWVLAFTFALSTLTALISAILPSLRASKTDPAEALKYDTSRGITHRKATLLRNGLIVAEVAASFVLVVGAGLLLHTMTNLMQRDMGYEPRQLLVVDSDTPANGKAESLGSVQQYREIFSQLQNLPGVSHVAGIMGLPTGNYGSNGQYQVVGGLQTDPANSPSALFSVASPGYFQAMNIPMARGRDFTWQDNYDNQYVAVISESLARQSFGNADPIGKQIRCGLDSDKWMTIVGVVRDVRQDSPAETPGPNLYMPMAQHPFFANQIHIVLRTKIKPLTLMQSVRQVILKRNPFIALQFTTMDEMMDKSVATERFRAALLSSFAIVGVLLAMLGIYGTMAYSVTQRTFEIGIRMTFGAEKQAILNNVLRNAAKLACYGIGIGATASFLLSRLLTSMLVEVKPLDPVSFAAAACLLVLTALAAAFAPGWKATSVNPMTTLRSN